MAKKTKEPEVIPEIVVEEEPVIEAPAPQIVTLVTQSGYANGKTKVSAYNCMDFPVAFEEPYDEGTAPTVVVGLVSGSTAARFGSCGCAVLEGSVTNEGFTIRFFNGDTNSRIPACSWIACGRVTRGAVSV